MHRLRPAFASALCTAALLACDHAAAPPAAVDGCGMEGDFPVRRPASAAATADDPRLMRLRAAMPVTILDDHQDDAYWALTREVADARILVGRARTAVERTLGPGQTCPDGWCNDAGDRVYAVGRLRYGWNGGTPNLIVDYDAGGTCVGTRAMHTQ